MKKLAISLCLAAGLTLTAGGILTACSGNSRIDDFKELVEQVKEDGSTYTKEQWKKANAKFTELLDKINSYEDLTDEELREVGRLQGEYAAVAFKANMQEAAKGLEKAGVMLDGFFEGLTGDEDNDSTENQ